MFVSAAFIDLFGSLYQLNDFLRLGVFIGLCQMEKDYSRYVWISQCLRLSVVLYSRVLKPGDGSIARRPSFGPAPF